VERDTVPAMRSAHIRADRTAVHSLSPQPPTAREA